MFPLKWLSDAQVARRYREAGEVFGDALSYLPSMGKCDGFDQFSEEWGRLEREYSARGYRTVPLDVFVEAGGYGRDITALMGVRRDEGEEPVLRASLPHPGLPAVGDPGEGGWGG